MKKALLYTLILVFGATNLCAQSRSNIFSLSDANQITIAAGFWTNSEEFTPKMPQLSINYERLVADFGRWGALGAGLHMSYIESKYDRFDNENWILKDGVVGARITYHYTIIADRLEAYAGAMAGYRTNKLSNPDLAPTEDKELLSPRKSGFAYSFSAGVKYWFIPRLALCAAIGDGVYLNVGLATKF